MSLPVLPTRKSSTNDDETVIIRGSRAGIPIEDLRSERDYLKLQKLRYEAEYELCDAVCKSTCEKYHLVKAQRNRAQFLDDVNNKLISLREPLDQLTLDCWMAFEYLGRSIPTIPIIPTITITSPTGEVSSPSPGLSRQLTPYPGKMENNKRVTTRNHAVTHASSSKQTPAKCDQRKSLGKREYTFLSDLPLQGEVLSRISAGTTLVANTARPSVSGPSDHSRPSSSSSSVSISSSPSTSSSYWGCTFEPIKPGPKSSRHKTPLPPLESLLPFPLPLTYTNTTFHAHHIALQKIKEESSNPREKLSFLDILKASYSTEKKRKFKKKEQGIQKQLLLEDIQLLRKSAENWEGRCRERWCVWEGIRRFCEEELGVGWDEEEVVGGEGGSMGEGNKGEGRGARPLSLCGLQWAEIIPIRRFREKLEKK